VNAPSASGPAGDGSVPSVDANSRRNQFNMPVLPIRVRLRHGGVPKHPLGRGRPSLPHLPHPRAFLARRRAQDAYPPLLATTDGSTCFHLLFSYTATTGSYHTTPSPLHPRPRNARWRHRSQSPDRRARRCRHIGTSTGIPGGWRPGSAGWVAPGAQDGEQTAIGALVQQQAGTTLDSGHHTGELAQAQAEDTRQSSRGPAGRCRSLPAR